MEYFFIIDEIKNMLSQSLGRTDCNFTERYYYTRFLRELRLNSIKLEFEKMLDLPGRQQLMERVAIFVAQSLQPEKDVFYSNVKTSLDRIAQDVLNCLREKHLKHSIFSTSDETFSYWENNNIDDNHWDEKESTQIMDTLQKYIFEALNYRTCNPRDTTVECLYIDRVLKNKCGHEIILLIIYQRGQETWSMLSNNKTGTSLLYILDTKIISIIINS
ncbi:uncharacterized protein LOC114932240 [Nylanderia fulva]|uniref:uncharacterized protein LOC114932240 n=1 Tax=Nylanderia fulva TaxID=613905 RepID=UPI0010FB2C11|nr:uncharacterized protein LOC114932240 [Nylanderia fulva]